MHWNRTAASAQGLESRCSLQNKALCAEAFAETRVSEQNELTGRPNHKARGGEGRGDMPCRFVISPALPGAPFPDFGFRVGVGACVSPHQGQQLGPGGIISPL